MNTNLQYPVAFYQNREIIFGLAIPEQDGFWSGVDEKGSLFRHPRVRLVVIGEAIYTDSNAQDHLRDFRMEMEAEREKLSHAMPDILGGKEMSLAEIASQIAPCTNPCLFAIYLILVDNPELYHQKNGIFRLNTEAEQDEIRRTNEIKTKRRDYLEEVQGFIAGGLLGMETQHQLFTELPLLAQEGGAKDLQRLITAAYPRKDLFAAVQEIRIRCGELSQDTDPIVTAGGIPVGFSDLVLNEALISTNEKQGATCIFSIDDEDTRDYDDAISIEVRKDGYRLGIHVSSVASRIDPSGNLHHEAARRGASFYGVQSTVPMLPPCYSEQELSLVAGTLRPVLSLYLELDTDGSITNRNLVQELLRVDANYSYRQVDKQIHEEPFCLISRLCNAHKAKRDVELAGDKQRFYYYFRMVQGNLQLKMIDNLSPSRMMVEELMIMFNSNIAEIARENGLPVIYRNINRFGGTEDESYSSQAYLSTRGEFHPGIGSASYLHATSPIRRYTDLANHYQILSLLQHKPALFSEDELLEKIVQIEKKLLSLKELSHRSDRHWCLKYIESRYLHEPLDACIKGTLRNLLRIEIIPWGKQIIAQCDHYPTSDVFKIAVHAIDWDKGIVHADIL